MTDQGFTFASPSEACDALIPRLAPLETGRVDLDSATGRILAEPLLADRDSPGADVSAMDGYAVRLDDLSAGRLPVVAESDIGQPPPVLAPGTTLRIVTGAGVPAEADAVIRREDVDETPTEISFHASLVEKIKPGAHIRRAAENLKAGEQVVPAGTTITPSVAAALATFGVCTPLVRSQLRVSLIMTGDEVLPPTATPSPWQLRDSHRSTLTAMLGACPWVEVVSTQHCRDDFDTIHDAISAAMSCSNAIILTGGVSVGPKDFVRAAAERAGTEVVFHRLPQRPGKPVLGGVGPGGQAVLALPGNPVSVMVTARRIGEAVFSAMASRRRRRPSRVHLAETDGKTIPLWWHRLVHIRDDGRAQLIANKGSGDLAGAARADGFIEVPPNQATTQDLPFYPWAWS